MRKSHKFTLICCGMIAAGLLLVGTGLGMGGRVWGIGLNQHGIWVNTPNSLGSNVTYIEASEELDSFTNIITNMDYGKLTIEPSDHFGISYRIASYYDFAVNVRDGCLIIEETPKKNIGFGGVSINSGFFAFGTGRDFEKEYVTIQIPADARFDDVKIKNSSGDVNINNLDAGQFELTAEYGNVILNGLKSQNALVTLESGNLEFTDFSDGTLTIHDDYGNVTLNNLESESADILLESGNLKLAGFSGGNLSICAEYGTADLDSVSMQDLTIDMESGDFTSNSLSGDTLLLKQQFGNIDIQAAAFSENVQITNESGDTSLSYLETGALKVESDYGKVKGKNILAPACNMILESGDCTVNEFDTNHLDIRSAYGNVKLALVKSIQDYKLDLTTEYGDVDINKTEMGDSYKSLEEHDNSLVIHCESGDITITDGIE